MFSRSRRATVLSIAALGAAGLILTGCNSSGSAPSTPDPVASEFNPVASATATGAAAQIEQAAQNTAASGSAKMAGTMTTTGAGADQTAKFEGAYDFNDQSMQMEISGGLFEGTQKAEMIVIGGTSYVKMPGVIPGAEDKWIKTDIGEMTGTDIDPQQSLDSLKEMANLQEAGTETLDGVETTKYTGTMSLDEALADSGVTSTAVPKNAAADMTVWIDNENRIRQIKTESKVAGVSSVVTMRFYDFGVETDISAPPSDQVIDSQELTKGLTGGQSIPTP